MLTRRGVVIWIRARPTLARAMRPRAPLLLLVAAACALAPAPASGKMANHGGAKGSAQCGAYVPGLGADVYAADANGDPSLCAFGHVAADEEQGVDCLERPAFRCNFCTRAEKAGRVRNHTCACVSERRREELVEAETRHRLGWSWALFAVGVAWLLAAFVTSVDEERYDRVSLVARGARFEDAGLITKLLIDFAWIWMFPLAAVVAGATLLGIFYGRDPDAYYRGCCDGYETCHD